MFIYDCFYFKNGNKYTATIYADNLQQAVNKMAHELKLSSYDLELSKQKNNNGDCVADYVLYKHAIKTTFYINQVA